MRGQNFEAIVLKNVNYKDSHRIYTLFSKEKGKISAIARGVRKISSKRSGSLDTLNHVKVGLHEDKNGFYSISEVSVIHSFLALKENLDLILAGMYLCELVDLFVDGEHESAELFRLLKTGLSVLSKNPSHPERVINVFELRLLEKLGIGLPLDNLPQNISSILYEMQKATNLSETLNYSSNTARFIDSSIKNHLKVMVETYARYPKLNRFLTQSIG